jgi:hypothetical protein
MFFPNRIHIEDPAKISDTKRAQGVMNHNLCLRQLFAFAAPLFFV